MENGSNEKQLGEREQPFVDFIIKEGSKFTRTSLNVEKLIPNPNIDHEQVKFRKEVRKQLKFLYELEKKSFELMPEKMRKHQ